MEMTLPLWTIQGFKPLSWKWIGKFSIILLLSLSMVLMGCSFASFVAAAEEDIPVVIQMITNVTNVVAAGVSPQIQAAGGLALASLAILCGAPAIGATKCDPTSLIGQYQVATDGPTKTSLLQKIQAALVAVNSQLNDIIALGKGVLTPVGTAIVTAVGIALSTVTLLISLIPVAISATAKGMTEKDALSSAKKSGIIVNWPERASTLKKRFNATVEKQWPTAVIH